jgi:hypothetical protein
VFGLVGSHTQPADIDPYSESLVQEPLKAPADPTRCNKV